MAVTRQVIDKTKGVQRCDACEGRGVKMQTLRMGSIIQQMQSKCDVCGGQGKSFKTLEEREVLQVPVQKGAPDGHKIPFREMADEHPDADTGDVVFVLKEEKHNDFKRKGADLFVERTISLSEALCGFSLELMHLDGRKLIIKTAPGDIVRPMMQGFDPLTKDENKMEWDVLEGYDCPSIETVARADTTDVDALKKACETQLKRQGVDVGAFVVDGQRTFFKQATREEILAAKKPAPGCKMYILADPNSKKSWRLTKAVKDEGMPTLKNPFVHGNLFLLLTVEFPESLSVDTQKALRDILPQEPLLSCSLNANDPTVEVCTLTDIDPIQSFQSNKVSMKSGNEAYDEDAAEDEGPGMRGPGGVQCHQM